MSFKHGKFILITTAALCLGSAFTSAAATADDDKLKILFITGGGWHDFTAQEKILTKGIGERLNVEFTVDHEAGDDPAHRLRRFEDPDWAKGYDLVLYNMSLSTDQKPETAQAIIDSHVKHGVPAALLHGSTHSYRRSGNENWFRFMGGRSMRHERQGGFTNEVLVKDHPVMRGFPAPWVQPQGELYVIEEMFPTATALAHAMGTNPEKHQPTIWVNEYKGVRVFVTTIGHHNETMASDVYLDLVSRGIQWAVGAGDDGFKPIFNGENLDGWAGMDGYWSVEDGAIVGQFTAENPIERNTFLIWEEGELKDFELRFKYRIASDKANSGVQVRSKRHDDFVVSGYQPDIANVDWITGIIYEERGRNILARRGQKTVINADGERKTTRFAEEADLGEHINPKDWNDYHVRFIGNHLVVTINGAKMSELVDDGPEAASSGILAFQLHQGPPMRIEFKDIHLKQIESGE